MLAATEPEHDGGDRISGGIFWERKGDRPQTCSPRNLGSPRRMVQRSRASRTVGN